MSESFRERLKAFAPWRDDVSWQIVAAQGSGLLLISLYLMFATTHAVGTLSQIVGAYIAGVSALHLFQAVRDPGGLAARPSGLLRRFIGLVAGTLVLFFPWIGFISSQDARWIVAIALIGGGLVAVVGAFTDRRLRVIRWGSSFSGFVEIALGIGFLIVTDSDRPVLTVLVVIMAIAGLVLLGKAVWTTVQQKEATNGE